MKLKVCKIVYFIIFMCLTVAAIIFGVLCLRNDRLPEGFIIMFGTLTVVVIMIAISWMSHDSNRAMTLAVAGPVVLTMKCVGYFDSPSGKECVLNLCKYGILIEASDVEFDTIFYSDIYDAVIKKYEISFSSDINYRFICNNSLQIKAAVNFLESVKCL